MKSRVARLVLMVAALATTGAALRPLAPMPAENADAAADTFGGFRAVAADAAWLRANVAWEERNAATTEALVRLVVALDPRPVYFWVNGARMIAYDLPAWRIDAAGGYARVSAARQREIAAEQARQALDLLEMALARHPASAALWIERASIELNGLRDVRAAADSYRRASEQPGVPYFAARLHAELLRRQGRDEEALAWLVRLYPRLPRDDEAAEAGLVLARIRGLERELGIPATQAYAPPY